MGKKVNHTYVGTKSKIKELNKKYPNATQIVDADVYWDDASGSVFVFTSNEYKAYLLGKREGSSEIWCF